MQLNGLSDERQLIKLSDSLRLIAAGFSPPKCQASKQQARAQSPSFSLEFKTNFRLSLLPPSDLPLATTSRSSRSPNSKPLTRPATQLECFAHFRPRVDQTGHVGPAR